MHPKILGENLKTKPPKVCRGTDRVKAKGFVGKWMDRQTDGMTFYYAYIYIYTPDQKLSIFYSIFTYTKYA